MDRSRDLSAYPGHQLCLRGSYSWWTGPGTFLLTLTRTVSMWVLFLMDRSRDLSVYPGQDCVYVVLIFDGQVQRPFCLPCQDCVYVGLILYRQIQGPLCLSVGQSCGLILLARSWALFVSCRPELCLNRSYSWWPDQGHLTSDIWHVGQDCVSFLMERSKDPLFSCRPGLCLRHS
jgi:hypothetical protein